MSRPIGRILQQVGLANLLWNRVEGLWYLYFTCLLPGAERARIDAIYRSVDTGHRKRALVLAVASESFDEHADELIRVRALVGRTNELAVTRNALIHGQYQLVREGGVTTLRIARGGDDTKPNRLGFLELEPELDSLLSAIKSLIAEVEALLPRSPQLPPGVPEVLTTTHWVALLEQALASEGSHDTRTP